VWNKCTARPAPRRCQVWSHKCITRRESLAFRSHSDTRLPIAGLARSPTSLVVDACLRSGTSDVCPAVPRSVLTTIQREDQDIVALSTHRRGTACEPQPWQKGGATPGCTRFVGHDATPAGAEVNSTLMPGAVARSSTGVLLAPRDTYVSSRRQGVDGHRATLQ